MIADKYRVLVVFVGFLCLVAVCANYMVVNFTFICMKTDMSQTIVEGNKTRSAFDYTPDEKKYIIWAVAAGTILGTFPINYIYVKWHARYPFFFSGMLSAAATAVLPFAAEYNYYLLLFVRFFQGVAFSADFATVGVITVRWAPLSELAIFLGALTCFTSFASVMTNGISGAICTTFGWRYVFYIHAGISVIVFTLWILIYHDHPQMTSRVSATELRRIQKNKSEDHIQAKAGKVPWKKLFTSPVVLCVWFNAFAEMSVIMFLHTYAPLFFNRILKFKVAETGYLVALSVFIPMPLKLVGGVISDKAKCFSEKAKMLFFNVISVGCCGLFVCVIGFVPQELNYVAVILFSVTFLCMAFNCAAFYKCATLHTRQYSHVVIAAIQWMKSISLITGPALVAAVVRDEDNAAQWRIVLLILGGLNILATVFAFFIFTDKPAEWTESSTKPVVYEKKTEDVSL